jgi:hypothetical protein
MSAEEQKKEATPQSFDKSQKKKKKKPSKPEDKKMDGKEAPAQVEVKKEEQKTALNGVPAAQPDYTYEFMLNRIYALLDSKQKTSAIKRKVVLPPPDVQRLMGRRSTWANFIVSLNLIRTGHVLVSGSETRTSAPVLHCRAEHRLLFEP